MIATIAIAAPVDAKHTCKGHVELPRAVFNQTFEAPVTQNVGCGMTVNLYSADNLTNRLTVQDGQDIIPLDDGRYLSVITDINDPAIYNPGDGEFHPFHLEDVWATLEAIAHPSLDYTINVYVLPYPRRQLLVSSTSGIDVFLSPHVLDVHPSVAAYIIAHEVGHTFHNTYLPVGSPGWSKFRSIRGITNTSVYHDGAAHAYRPKEVLAEDFRVLFGGPDAAYGGTVENPELVTPTSVTGLRSFFLALGGVVADNEPEKVVATNYPNPFNPDTEIRINLPAGLVPGQQVTVSIFNARGALVKTLYQNVPNGDQVFVRWDGTDRVGNRVASANYFADIRAGGARTTLKMVLLK